MDDEISVNSNHHFCVNHTMTQNSIDALKSDVQKIYIEIERLHSGKAKQSDLSEFGRELSRLSTQIESIIASRQEDIQAIQQLRSEVQQLSEMIQQYAISNAEMKVNMEHMANTMTIICSKLETIEKNTTFNWLELLQSFFMENWIRKILSWTMMCLLAVSVVSIFIWFTTGENLFPYLYNIWINWMK